MRATSTPWPLLMPSASAPTTDLGTMLLITSTSSLLRKACSSTENGSGWKLMACKPSGAWRGVMTNCFLRAPTVVAPAPVARLDALPAPLDVAAELDDDGAAAGGDVADDGAGDAPAARVLPLSAVSPAAGVAADDAPRPVLRPSSVPDSVAAPSEVAPSEVAPGSGGADAPPY